MDGEYKYVLINLKVIQIVLKTIFLGVGEEGQIP